MYILITNIVIVKLIFHSNKIFIFQFDSQNRSEHALLPVTKRASFYGTKGHHIDDAEAVMLNRAFGFKILVSVE